MAWPEKGEEDFKREHEEQKIMEYKKALFESGLLERIEKKRLEIEKKETVHNFDLYPRLAYESNRDSDHFLKEPSFLHTQYSIKHSGWYSSFCVEVTADGVYWKSGQKTKKLKLEKISDQEIHDWFALLAKK
ncbi:MAG: hypothetical protein KKH04_07250 [Proteobacteria bacterium]|nr:hypothetical protein [Pseudomonadota bacterium]